jgi:hypothetical protein
MSRFIPGFTEEEELRERIYRINFGLRIRTEYNGREISHWQSQDAIRYWFFEMFRETLIWSHGRSRAGKHYHYWLPGTEDQAIALKLAWGGSQDD